MITITSSNKQYTGRMSYKARVKLARLGYKLRDDYLRLNWDRGDLLSKFRNKYGY